MEIATTEEKFHSAVELIKSLPKSGSVQPSNETKLKFYSFFKQATEGPCELPRPSFWDVVNRAKWDAWNKLGNMSKEDAMQNYVDEFVKVLQTTPFDDQNAIKEFIHVMGPYIEYAPKEIKEHMLLNGKANKMLSKPEDINEDYNMNSTAKSSKGFKNEYSEESSEGLFSAASTLNGHNINGGNESDSEEFSDTLDRVNEWDSASDTATNSMNLISNVKGPSIVSVRGGGDQRVGMRDGNSPVASTSGNLGSRSSRQPRNSEGTLQQSAGNINIGGTGGSRRNGGSIVLESSADMHEQLALAVIRLQHTMEQVVVRLDSLEALLLEKKASTALQVSSKTKSYWSFLGFSPRAAILILAWPFIAQWIMHMIRKRQRQM